MSYTHVYINIYTHDISVDLFESLFIRDHRGGYLRAFISYIKYTPAIVCFGTSYCYYRTADRTLQQRRVPDRKRRLRSREDCQIYRYIRMCAMITTCVNNASFHLKYYYTVYIYIIYIEYIIILYSCAGFFLTIK